MTATHPLSLSAHSLAATAVIVNECTRTRCRADAIPVATRLDSTRIDTIQLDSSNHANFSNLTFL
jgi:hypothetical protein